MFLRNITGEQYRGHAGSLPLSLTGEQEDIPLHYHIPALVDRLVAVVDDDILENTNLARPLVANDLTQQPLPPWPHSTVRFQQDDHPAVPSPPLKEIQIQGLMGKLSANRGDP